MKCYVIRIEFQFWGAPPIHNYLLILHPVQLSEDRVDCIEFICIILSANLLSEKEDPLL